MKNKLRVKRAKFEDHLVECGYLERDSKDGMTMRVKEVVDCFNTISEKTGINASSLAQVCDCMIIDGKYEYHKALEALASLFEVKN